MRYATIQKHSGTVMMTEDDNKLLTPRPTPARECGGRRSAARGRPGAS